VTGRELYVIVLNWNGEKVIAPCLRSLEQVEEPKLHTIVVDNGSTDSSPDIVEREFPGVELIRNERNLLFAEGNNVGLRRAIERGGSLFLLLNNDTEVAPDFAARMVSTLDGSAKAGIVGPKIFYHDDPGRIWYGGGEFYPVIWIPRHRNIRKLDRDIDDQGGETSYVTGCALLVTKDVIDSSGMLDPSYRIYCEDVDFCLRARAAGWSCIYEPAAHVWHKVSSSSGGGFTPFKMENRLSSTFMLFRRFKPLWWRLLLFPVHAAGFALLCAGLLLTGRFGLLGGALKGAGRILKGR
jgi:GT2 family glycosyltransferase